MKVQRSLDSGSNPDQGAIVTWSDNIGNNDRKLVLRQKIHISRLEWARNSVWQSGWLLTNLSRVQIPSGPLY